MCSAIAFDGIPVFLSVVIPAKAGIQGFKTRRLPWIPDFAGMTVENEGAAIVKCDSPATKWGEPAPDLIPQSSLLLM
jgi:hypothetical protein